MTRGMRRVRLRLPMKRTTDLEGAAELVQRDVPEVSRPLRVTAARSSRISAAFGMTARVSGARMRTVTGPWLSARLGGGDFRLAIQPILRRGHQSGRSFLASCFATGADNGDGQQLGVVILDLDGLVEFRRRSATGARSGFDYQTGLLARTSRLKRSVSI